MRCKKWILQIGSYFYCRYCHYCTCFSCKKWWNRSTSNRSGSGSEKYEMSNIFKRTFSIQGQQNPMHMTEDQLSEYIIG